MSILFSGLPLSSMKCDICTDCRRKLERECKTSESKTNLDLDDIQKRSEINDQELTKHVRHNAPLMEEARAVQSSGFGDTYEGSTQAKLDDYEIALADGKVQNNDLWKDPLVLPPGTKTDRLIFTEACSPADAGCIKKKQQPQYELGGHYTKMAVPFCAPPVLAYQAQMSSNNRTFSPEPFHIAEHSIKCASTKPETDFFSKDQFKVNNPWNKGKDNLEGNADMVTLSNINKLAKTVTEVNEKLNNKKKSPLEKGKTISDINNLKVSENSINKGTDNTKRRQRSPEMIRERSLSRKKEKITQELYKRQCSDMSVETVAEAQLRRLKRKSSSNIKTEKEKVEDFLRGLPEPPIEKIIDKITDEKIDCFFDQLADGRLEKLIEKKAVKKFATMIGKSDATFSSDIMSSENE